MEPPGFRAHLAGLRRLRRRLDDDRPRRHPVYPNVGRGGPRLRPAHRGPQVRPAHDAPSRRGRPPRLAGTAVHRGPARAGRARPRIATPIGLCANLGIANEPAGNQPASRAYGPADQGHACRADDKLEVSAALAGRRIEPLGKTERVVLFWQLELPLLRPVRAAVPYRDRHIYTGAAAILQQQADLTGRPDCHGWFRGGMDAWPYDERAPAFGMAVRPGCPPR